MKKLFLLTVILCVAIIAKADYSGQCGDDLTWTLYTSTGVMVINGSGDMYNYTSTNPAPWKQYANQIKRIDIGAGCTSIGKYAFTSTDILTATIPSSVKKIGDNAFFLCWYLSSIQLPESLETIGDSSFNDCSDLTAVVFPNTLKSIGRNAFESCGKLTTITIPASVTSIGEGAFSECKALVSLNVVPENTMYDSRNNCNAIIETSTGKIVAGCKNTVIPETVTAIGYAAFEGCVGLMSITIPESVTAIGEYAFRYCSNLRSIAIPDAVLYIQHGAFWGCKKLSQVKLPKSVQIIWDYAFWDCLNLSTIVLPSSLVVIDDLAFKGCTGLTSIYCLATTPPSCDDNTFENVNMSIPVYVPEGCIGKYRIAYVWKDFNNYYEVPEGFGVDENDDVKASVYPNPVDSYLYINGEGITHIDVFSSDGKLVKSCLTDVENNKIDMRDFISGTYVVKIISRKGQVVRRIIKN